MLEILGFFIVFKAIIYCSIGFSAGLSGWMITLIIIGTLAEGIAAVLLGDSEKPVLKSILYYGGILFQVIPMIAMAVPYFSRPDRLNYMGAIAMGLVFVNIAVTWFANGFESWWGSVGVMSSGIVIYFVVTGLLSLVISAYALLIISAVLSGLSVVAIVVGFIVIGNNMH